MVGIWYFIWFDIKQMWNIVLKLENSTNQNSTNTSTNQNASTNL